MILDAARGAKAGLLWGSFPMGSNGFASHGRGMDYVDPISGPLASCADRVDDGHVFGDIVDTWGGGVLMPWRSSSVPAQRYEFVRLAESGQVPFSELCHRFGIGRSTGYKWLERFAMEGPVGLVDRPRRPKTSPGRTSADVEVALAQEEPTDLAASPRREPSPCGTNQRLDVSAGPAR